MPLFPVFLCLKQKVKFSLSKESAFVLAKYHIAICYVGIASFTKCSFLHLSLFHVLKSSFSPSRAVALAKLRLRRIHLRQFIAAPNDAGRPEDRRERLHSPDRDKSSSREERTETAHPSSAASRAGLSAGPAEEELGSPPARPLPPVRRQRRRPRAAPVAAARSGVPFFQRHGDRPQSHPRPRCGAGLPGNTSPPSNLSALSRSRAGTAWPESARPRRGAADQSARARRAPRPPRKRVTSRREPSASCRVAALALRVPGI